jgi:hypothetical protein
MLKHVRKQYERTNPTVVCGFGVTREAAEAALAQHPKGTFLLRFGSQVRSVQPASRRPRPAGAAAARACPARTRLLMPLGRPAGGGRLRLAPPPPSPPALPRRHLLLCIHPPTRRAASWR